MGSGGCCRHCETVDARLDGVEKSIAAQTESMKALTESFNLVKGLVFGAVAILLTTMVTGIAGAAIAAMRAIF